MARRISGCYRIGIVLSVIWVLVVSGIAIYECFRDRIDHMGLVDDIGLYSVFGMSISQTFVEVNIPIEEKLNTGKGNAFDIEEEFKREQTQPRKRDIFDIVGEGYDRKHAAKEKIPYYITFKIKNFLCVLFLPILGMWVLVLGILRSILWIKEGFKK